MLNGLLDGLAVSHLSKVSQLRLPLNNRRLEKDLANQHVRVQGIEGIGRQSTLLP